MILLSKSSSPSLLRTQSFSSSLSSSSFLEDPSPNSHNLITIVGAGAAGLAASYELRKQEYGQYEPLILEASHDIGGRVRKDVNFMQQPIDLGASFIIQMDEKIDDIAGPTLLREKSIQLKNKPKYRYKNIFVNYRYVWYYE